MFRKKKTESGDKKVKLTTFYVSLTHCHGGIIVADLAKLEAASAKDALERAQSWLKSKREQYHCDQPGCKCFVHVRKPRAMARYYFLFGAEEIE